MSELVRIEGLTKSFVSRHGLLAQSRRVTALDRVDLTLSRGKSLGLVGESGSGKTTLGRTLLRLYDPTAGRIVFDNVDITNLSTRALRPLRQRMQMIFQDPFASLNPKMRLYDILEEPLLVHHRELTDAQRRERIANALADVGLAPEHERRFPREFSGGQRQRIGIARALIVQPELIVADEPVAALDVSIQSQIINLLDRLRAKHHLSVLFISHDLRLVAHFCDDVAVMYLGRIVELAPAQTLFATPAHPYTAALLAAIPVVPNSQNPEPVRLPVVPGEIPSPAAPPPGCHFHPRCARYEELGAPNRCSAESPALTAHISGSVACHFPLVP
jgi:oligopeptide/dipeptide ABC transporter ATP-binding protein